MSVFPIDRATALKLSPVAVPCRGTESTLRNIVVSFAMPSHIQDFVDDVVRRSLVQGINLNLELLPLRRVGVATSLRGWICACDKSEVGLCVVEGSRIGGWLVLEEVAWDGCVVNVARPSVVQYGGTGMRYCDCESASA